MTSEVWKSIPGYESFYEVSSLGRVRSLPRTGGTTSVRSYGGKIVTSFPAGTMGYPYVSLWDNNKRQHHAIHRLVLLAFVGYPLAGQECCHGNGVVTDNRLENLRWDYRAGNERDKYRLGTGLRGSRANSAKLNEAQVIQIRLSNDPRYRLAKRFGVSESQIARIQSLQNWSWLPTPKENRAP